jgi:hypothetical protein
VDYPPVVFLLDGNVSVRRDGCQVGRHSGSVEPPALSEVQYEHDYGRWTWFGTGTEAL